MADPLVVTLMQAFKDRLLSEERRSMVLMAQKWGIVERSLLKDIEKLVAQLQEEGITPAKMQSKEFQRDRLAGLLAQARAQMALYATFAEGEISKQQKKSAKDGIKNAGLAIDAVTMSRRTKLDFDKLPASAVEYMVGHTGDGSPLREHLMKAFGDGAQGMIDKLIESTARGRNPRETARAMVREGFSKSLNRMLTTARTEKLRVYRESNRQAYIKSGVVTSYLRSAARDERTCIGCLAADGWEYQLKESFKSHPTCRCALIPKVKGFNKPTWEQGPQWFAKQPVTVQERMLGPTRYKAYKEQFNGRLEPFVHETHNPVWGDGITTASLKQLGLKQVKPEKKVIVIPEVAPIVFKQFDDKDEGKEWGDSAMQGWVNSLTEAEKNAIDTYSSSKFSNVNIGLRTDTLSEETEKIVELLDSAISKSSIPEEVTVFRGVQNPVLLKNFESLLGTVIDDKAFVSTSLNRQTAFSFAHQEGPKEAILMRINLKKGDKAAWIEPFANNPGESELLLPRGTKFMVTRTEYDENKEFSGMLATRYIDVEILPEEVTSKPVVEPERVYRKFESVNEMGKWGTKGYSEWQKNLTDDEKEAIDKYSSNEYHILNAYSRQGGEPSDETLQRIKEIDSVIEKSSLPEDVIAYRGLNSEDIAANFDSSLGTVITDKAFISTSLDSVTSVHFATGGRPSQAVLVHVKLKKGSKAAWVEDISQAGEMELLLPRDSQFIVTKIYEAEAEDKGGRKIPMKHMEVELL